MYLAYTYLITNKTTHQFYYGSRYQNIKFKRTPKEDFWIYYFTSSKVVKRMIEEYGTESFDVQIIMEDEDYDKCYFYEQELIAEHLREELCLNGFCHLINKFSGAGVPRSEKTKSKISISMSGLNNPNYGRGSRTGAILSDETKQKISLSRMGEKNHNYGKPPHNKGIPATEATKAKMSAARRGKPSCKKGKPISEEQKIKQKASMLAFYERKKSSPVN